MDATPDPAKAQTNRTCLIQWQEANLARQLEWIRAVDSKVPIIIGLAIAMLAILGGLSPDPTNLTVVKGLLMLVGGVPLVGSLGWCVAATFPRTKGPDGSLVYFGSVSKMSAANYGTAVSTRTDEEYLQDLNTQCHRNAQIATAKYRAIQRALMWKFIGTPLWLIAAYLLYKG